MASMQSGSSTATRALMTMVLMSGGLGLAPAMAEQDYRAAQERSDRQRAERGPSIREQATTQATDHSLPGHRRVGGRIKDIRSDQIEIDIGNVQSLTVPLKMAADKGQSFKRGDEILVTLSDHNAVVDYHHPEESSHHQVVRGKSSTPLTVGLDKAVIETNHGTQVFLVEERAKGKLRAMPVGAEVLFMADETGRLVDAQLASVDAVHQSSVNNKARIKGAHAQRRVVFQGIGGDNRIKITDQGRKQEVPIRAPLRKLDQLKAGQEVVLLMDEAEYVMKVSTPDLMPTR